MLKGNYREAERYLKQAETLGCTEASANLRELKRKLANVNSRREAGAGEEDEPAAPVRRSNSRNR